MITRRQSLMASMVALALVGASCSSDGSDASPEPTEAPAPATEASPPATEASPPPTAGVAPGGLGDCSEPDEVSMQLEWVHQGEFAGYYAAVDQGFYADLCLDVTIVEGGVDLVPQTQLANGDVDFASAWVPKALASREAGANIVNIAQLFQRSGTLQVSFADSGIETVSDFVGRRIGNWGFGNEFELFSAIADAGLSLDDMEHIGQSFDMVALLEGEIDAAQAMVYNEWAQVLEATNPETGEQYQPEDFNVIKLSEIGAGMLQNAIWADGEKLATDPFYQDIAVRFVAGTIQGWIHCRDNIESCVQSTIDAGALLGESHQRWQVNEVNQLVWPSPSGIGLVDQELWDATDAIAQATPNLDGDFVLSEPPDEEAFTTEIVEAAWALLADKDLDLVGDDYEPIVVQLEPGGA